MSDNIPDTFRALRIFDDEHGYRAESSSRPSTISPTATS